jgi:Rieske Fe-S protein
MKQISDLQNNEGTVVEENGNKVAVYKDKTGKTHKLSPICTHKGCTVGWDPQNNSWACPCHGAMYTPDGHVISGPAPKDLTVIE